MIDKMTSVTLLNMRQSNQIAVDSGLTLRFYVYQHETYVNITW